MLNRFNRVWSKLWKKPWIKKQFYNAVGFFMRRSESAMLNCGYVLEEDEDMSDAPMGSVEDRSGIQLYWKLCVDVLRNGDSLLEIGSGRGGGLRFLSEWKNSSRAEGVDFAGRLARQSQKQFGNAKLRFSKASALSLPFGDNTFDAAVSVEVSCCIDDKQAYLNEALRVLKPGGYFIWADFFYVRETSQHSIQKSLDTIHGSGALLVHHDDLSKGVLAALAESSPKREAHIDKNVWKPFRELAKDFAVTKDSSLFRCLEEDRGKYLRFVLRK